jgi:predicted DNA-binding protein
MATELELLAKQYSKKKVMVLREDIQKNLNRLNQAALPFMRKLSTQAKKSKSNEIVLIAIIVE